MFGLGTLLGKKLGFSKILTQKFMKTNLQALWESQAVAKVQFHKYYSDFTKQIKDKFYIKEKI